MNQPSDTHYIAINTTNALSTMTTVQFHMTTHSITHSISYALNTIETK